MSQAQAESAIELLYSDTSVRDELTDDEAEVIIQWGIKHIKQLAAKELPEEDFEESFAQLTKLMSRINRFAARRAGQDTEKQQQSLDRIRESAEQVGLPITQMQLDAFLSQPVAQADDVNASLQQLLALVDDAPTSPDTSFTAQPAPAQSQETETPTSSSGFINAAAQRAQNTPQEMANSEASSQAADETIPEDDTTRSQEDDLSDPTEDSQPNKTPARSFLRNFFSKLETKRDSPNPSAPDPNHTERPATNGEETNDE